MQYRLISLLLAALAAAAGPLPVGPPAAAGLSPEALARATAAIEADVAAGRIPGAIGFVARKGRVAYLSVQGHADREAGREMREDTIFRIYSMSKPIASVALMMLFEEGKFRLDDPVSRYLPEFADMKVAVETPATRAIRNA